MNETLDWMETYCLEHDKVISDLEYVTRNYDKREIKDIVKQVGIETIVNEVGEDEIQNYLRIKKLNQIRDGLR